MNFSQLLTAEKLTNKLLSVFGFSNITNLQAFATQNPNQFWQEIKSRKIDLETEPEPTDPVIDQSPVEPVVEPTTTKSKTK